MERRQKTGALPGILAAVGCEVLFGMSFIFTKHVTDSVRPLALLSWRYLAAFLVMSLCILPGWIRVDLKGKSLRPLLRIALLSPCVYFLAETQGIRLTSASESGVFIACIPVVSLAASTLILHKRPTRRQTAGILIALAGVLITVAAVGTGHGISVPGYLFLTLAVVSCALYAVQVEKTAGYTNTEITYVMMAAGAAVFTVMALADAAASGTLRQWCLLPVTDPFFLGAIAYLGIGCSVVAFFLTNVAISRLGVNRFSSFAGICTVVSIVSGALLLHEPFTARQALGAAVILAGVYTANASGGGKQPER